MCQRKNVKSRVPLLLMLAVALVGCQNHAKTSTDTAQAHDNANSIKPAPSANIFPSMISNRSDLTSLPMDGDIFVQLDIYELVLPEGRISSNDEFWRRVDEDHVDLTNHDLMLHNGIRYGIGHIEDWPYFLAKIDEFCPRSQRLNTPPAPSGFVPLTMRTGIESEDVWYVSGSELTGRSFHQCDNILNVSYEAIPHRPGDTRIKVGAMVQDLQQQLEVTVLNQSRQIDLVRPFQLYDLKLEAVVPNERFLIVARSDSSSIHSNLGSTFLLRPQRGEQMEVALIIVPRPFRIRQAPSLVQNAPANARAKAR